VKGNRSVDFEELKMLHTDKLISEVEAASESGARNLHTPDCVISPQTYNAALYAVGSVLDGVVEVAERRFDNAFCAVRPPGHHAENDYAMGFCFFNKTK
jgi:acetoin utilization deacetylase AcuC-like enzyme